MAKEKKEGVNYWSQDVKTKWHPPEGFFEESATKIAEGLFEASDSEAQAMDRLNFFINRAGKNLKPEHKAELEKVKPLLHDLFGK